MGHTTQQDLADKLKRAKEQVEVGGIYHHYKAPNDYYVVVEVGLIEETEGVCVVYKAQYGEGLVWVRPLEVWLSQVQTPTGEVPRFQKVE